MTCFVIDVFLLLTTVLEFGIMYRIKISTVQCRVRYKQRENINRPKSYINLKKFPKLGPNVT